MSVADELSDWFPKRLEAILTYNPPFSDSLKRLEDPAQLGPYPFIFYDRHLDENTRLKRVVLLPSFSSDIARQVDNHLEDLRTRGVDHLPMNETTWMSPTSDLVGMQRSMRFTSWDLGQVYRPVEAHFAPFISHWLISPDFPQYKTTLSFIPVPTQDVQGVNDPMLEYSLRFRDYEMHSPELLAHLDDLTKNMLRDLEMKDLATWIYLPVFPGVERALKEMDQIDSKTLSAATCTTGGIPAPKSAPWDSKPSLDALATPFTFPRVIAKKKTKKKSPISSKGITPDIRKDQRSDFARSRKPSPEGILHHAWQQAVQVDATVIVINCGSYERIGFRHRATQTLYLSGLIEVWKCEPSYGKLHLGLQMVVVRDAIDRYKQKIGQDLHKKPGRKRRRETPLDPLRPMRRSSRVAYHALRLGVARTQGKNGQAKADFWKAIDRPCALVSLQYRPFNSPAPAACLRLGQALSPLSQVDPKSYDWKTHFSGDECFAITFNSIYATGSGGLIHTGTLEVVVGNQTLRHEVLIKVATKSHPRKRLFREFAMYKQLWAHSVEGIPMIYGLFEDYDGLATLLVMENAGVPLRARQLASEEESKVTGVSPGEIIACVSIVEKIHQAGVLHRDLRMDNIVFAPDGKPKIIDFDRACLSTSESDHKLEIDSLKAYLSGNASFREWSITDSEED